jgi:hypothetical protein
MREGEAMRYANGLAHKATISVNRLNGGCPERYTMNQDQPLVFILIIYIF